MPRSPLGSTPCFLAAAIYMDSRMAAGALMVMLVETLSRGIPWKSRCMSSRQEMETPHPADLACCQGIVGIIADLCGQVEGHREAGLPLRQQVVEAAVGLGRAGVPGILPHGPGAAAVHGRVSAAGEGILAREAHAPQVVVDRLLGQIHSLQWNARGVMEGLLALGEFVQRGLQNFPLPVLARPGRYVHHAVRSMLPLASCRPSCSRSIGASPANAAKLACSMGSPSARCTRSNNSW